MLIVVTTVSFCVHVYSSEYMGSGPHLCRFMSYISLSPISQKLYHMRYSLIGTGVSLLPPGETVIDPSLTSLVVCFFTLLVLVALPLYEPIEPIGIVPPITHPTSVGLFDRLVLEFLSRLETILGPTLALTVTIGTIAFGLWFLGLRTFSYFRKNPFRSISGLGLGVLGLFVMRLLFLRERIMSAVHETSTSTEPAIFGINDGPLDHLEVAGAISLMLIVLVVVLAA